MCMVIGIAAIANEGQDGMRPLVAFRCPSLSHRTAAAACPASPSLRR